MRKKIYEIIEQTDCDSKLGDAYDYLMIVVIAASLVPLAFKQNFTIFQMIDKLCVTVFILDYMLRLLTADYKFGRHTWQAFLQYPFSFMAIIDLISILPSLTFLNSTFKLLRITRMIRALRVLRVFRTFRYSKSTRIIVNVFRRSKDALITVGSLAIGYILLSALVVFNVEPETFETFFDAVYWATVLLTSVGYGDIYPVSTIGKVITMVSSLFGIAIVALPAGIVTAGYMNEIRDESFFSGDNTKKS